ncbi:7167_t:CDS:2, partial [Cetraspora pellucida]
VENFVKTLLAVLSQLQNDNNKVARFFHFIYDVLGQLSVINKFFQKRNLYFRNIILMIDAMIASIQKNYITEAHLSYHFQLFIDHTNPFNNNDNITYYMHIFAYNSYDYDDLLQDAYEYASIITTEIRNCFPNYPLLATMKILNPIEWSCKKKELLEFSNDELQVLLNHYGSLKTINGQNFLPLVD